MITETEHTKGLRKSLEAICTYGHQPWRVFEDWVGLMFWAFQGKDPEYFKIMDRYKRDNDRKQDTRRRPADLFALALGQLMAHMKETNEETLGSLYEEFAANHYAGQFFTPSHLCNLMAQVTAGDGTVRGNIGDPACGAGAQLVAMAKVMNCSDVDVSLFVGTDVDINCVRMTTLNLMFFNLPGVVIHGNTLSTEAHGGWVTRRSYVWGGAITGQLSANEAREWIVGPFREAVRQREGAAALVAPAESPKPARKARPKPRPRPGQLVLFGDPEEEAA